jgi:hypothetical protein
MIIKEAILDAYKKWKYILFGILSFIVPFTIYVLTLEKKLIGGDTTWYALQIPEMYIMVPTGYPTFSIFLKLFTYIPIGDLAFRLNLFSALFGGITILFLYLAINRLIKNEILSLSSSLIFAFLFPYWFVANRLEFDTLNSFFLALVLFSAFLYKEKRRRKILYLFFFSLGLSLTNHPITFFVVPAILLYVIIVDPRVFKSIKTIGMSILWFIIPLLSYFYLIIRSKQGYGQVTDLTKLFYYITGRNVAGEVHGGTFFDKPLNEVFMVIKDYLEIFYDNFGLALIVIAIIGLGYLIKKDWKLGICSILFIIFNLAVPPLYLPYANDNYIIDSMMVIAVLIGFGFLLILDGSLWLFKKATGRNKKTPGGFALRNLLITGILFFSLFFAVLQPVLYFEQQDRSEPPQVHKFWEQAFEIMEEGSALYMHSFAENVGVFLGKYEYKEKNIELIDSRSQDYSIENIEKVFESGRPIYFVGNANRFLLNTEFEKAGRAYYFSRNKEILQLYRVSSMFEVPEISYSLDQRNIEFGEKFSIEYIIKNVSAQPLQVTSLELDIPDNVSFVDIDKDGYIKQGPGMSRGMYMWVSDEYYIEAEGSINLIILLQGNTPGKGKIKFRITTHDAYIEADDIKIEIK